MPPMTMSAEHGFSLYRHIHFSDTKVASYKASLLLSEFRQLRVSLLVSEKPTISGFKSYMDPNSQEVFDSSDSSSSSKLQLYSCWSSSCSWRVWFALNLKGLSYEYKSVDLSKKEQFSPEFELLNPLRYVPVLVDGDVVVGDSLAILLYLEEKYPQNALLPPDAKRRALNLQAANIVCSSIQPLHRNAILKYIEEKAGPGERLSWIEQNMGKGFAALEKLLKDSSGKYATGDELCMADVCLAPQISIAITRFNLDMSRFPTLSRLYEAYKVLPEFQASLPERQPDAIAQ